jgi:hypothetical protein
MRCQLLDVGEILLRRCELHNVITRALRVSPRRLVIRKVRSQMGQAGSDASMGQASIDPESMNRWCHERASPGNEGDCCP